jgi:lipopolysaccharide/colanic/teichoic acid biosynthesis glycosyltransferase
MLLLRFTGEGKIYYRQIRVGFKGKTFDLIKFATMLENSPHLPGGDITSSKDPRILPIGRFLRKAKINELPQLFNIFCGQMSFVGPRPLTPKNFDFYDGESQRMISEMKPGLTGVGSIVFRDEEAIFAVSKKNTVDCYREDISPFKGDLEKWYFENQSFKHYVMIVFVTGWVVVFPKSNIAWRVFPNLPVPSGSLRKHLNYLGTG